MRLEELEKTDLIEKALIPLAKRHNIAKEEARELFKKRVHRDQIDVSGSAFRSKMNDWWDKNRSQFPKLGLGILMKFQKPSKLPDCTYMQVCCLMLAEDLFKTQAAWRARDRKSIYVRKPKRKEPKYNYWLSFTAILRKTFQRFLKRRCSGGKKRRTG